MDKKPDIFTQTFLIKGAWLLSFLKKIKRLGSLNFLFSPKSAIYNLYSIVTKIMTKKTPILRKTKPYDALYAAMVESSLDAIICMDFDGTILAWNQGAEQLYGFDESEMQGVSIYKLIPDKRKKEESAYLKKIKNGQEAIHFATVRLKKDGSLINISKTLSAVKDDNGQIIAVASIAREIDFFPSEQKKVKDLFHQMIEAAPTGIIMVNLKGQIALANQQILKMFNYKREDLIGQNVEILIPKRFRKKHPDYRQLYFTAPKTKIIGTRRDLYAARQDGSEFLVQIGLNPLKTEQGSFVLASVIDVTERKKAEDLIKQSNRELERFAYVVSHDLKAPLRGIATVSQWLVEEYEEKLDEQGRQYFHLLKNRVRQLQALIDGILDYSRIGRLKEDIEAIDLNHLIKDITKLLSIPEHIDLHVAKQLPVIYAEKTLMYQLFQNLISNSIKFIDKEKGFIEIGVKELPLFWQFFIKDNGIGINEKYKDKIFELFQSLAGKEKPDSTGIGLTLAKKIVELYQGKIWFESNLGQGTTFYFTLYKEALKKD